MNLSSKTYTIQKNSKETFEFLSSVTNFKSLMPENLVQFDILDDNTFSFTLKGMPQIMLKKSNTEPYRSMSWDSASGKINFTLVCILDELSNNETEITLKFSSSLNPMMAMMAKKPISSFIQTLAENTQKLLQN